MVVPTPKWVELLEKWSYKFQKIEGCNYSRQQDGIPLIIAVVHFIFGLTLDGICNSTLLYSNFNWIVRISFEFITLIKS